MFSLVCSSDSAPRGGRTVPRTMSRTALREDPRNLNGNSDSPSGGPSNSPSGKRSKLRPLYGVAHIRCHLSGRASPSRTSSCRNPDSLSALRNYFVGGREESQIMQWHLLRVQVRTWIRFERPLSTPIYRVRGYGEKPKMPSKLHHCLHHHASCIIACIIMQAASSPASSCKLHHRLHHHE
jgi:hypothetical protein